MPNDDQIEVFQELKLSLKVRSCLKARDELGKCAANTPWHRVKDFEKSLEKRAMHKPGTAMVFRRGEGKRIPAVRLSLWLESENANSAKNGNLQYKLGNIVPEDLQRLNTKLYNDALEDFLYRVANNAKSTVGVTYETSPRHQSMSYWTSEAAAKELRFFSGSAEKYTALGHDVDTARWRKFVSIAFDSSSGSLDSTLLRRWLVEVDEWPEELALELAIDWERSREQLEAWIQYDNGKISHDRPESMTN